MPTIQIDDSTSRSKLPSHTRVVIIGSGVVGCSILFHLAIQVSVNLIIVVKHWSVHMSAVHLK